MVISFELSPLFSDDYDSRIFIEGEIKRDIFLDKYIDFIYSLYVLGGGFEMLMEIMEER